LKCGNMEQVLGIIGLNIRFKCLISLDQIIV